MTAKFEESKKFDSNKLELIQATKAALERCDFKIENINEELGSIRAKSKLTWWSWTEDIDIKIDKIGTVNIKSKCSFPFQVFDWGKNKRNVRAFFTEMESVLG